MIHCPLSIVRCPLSIVLPCRCQCRCRPVPARLQTLPHRRSSALPRAASPADRARAATMGGSRQPFMYRPVRNDDRFPTVSFDPKAVTRASYEPKPPKKPRPKGPLISINRHPEYVMSSPHTHTIPDSALLTMNPVPTRCSPAARPSSAQWATGRGAGSTP